MQPDPAYLRERLDYNPLTGTLTWRHHPSLPQTWLVQHAGQPAGRLHRDGYRYIKLLGRTLSAHRVAWAIATGSWPPPTTQIDHINGDKADNRLSNLREATSVRRPAQRSSASGARGVFFDPAKNRWRARARLNGTRVQLGWFRTIEEAAQAYDAFAAEHHAEFKHTKKDLT